MGRVLHLGPSWHGPSFMWADLAWAELVLGLVVLHPETQPKVAYSRFSCYTFQIANSNGADQTAWTRRLNWAVCCSHARNSCFLGLMPILF